MGVNMRKRVLVASAVMVQHQRGLPPILSGEQRFFLAFISTDTVCIVCAFSPSAFNRKNMGGRARQYNESSGESIWKPGSSTGISKFLLSQIWRF